MSTTTTNLGLLKPELNDPADITQMNQNWDALDGLIPSVGATPYGLVTYNKTITSEDELNAAIIEVYETLRTNTFGFAILNVTVSSLSLSGGVWHITLYRVTEQYGHVVCCKYGDDAVYRRDLNDGNWGKWHVQSIPASGGVLKGNLDFKKVDNGSATIYKNHNATEDYGIVVRDVIADGSYSQLILCAKENALKYRDATGKTGQVYSSINKPTPADIGAAPSGYGLGGVATQISDWNTASQTGFYKGATNSPNGQWFEGFVVSYNETHCVQSVWRASENIHCQRQMVDGVWGEWEYVNPPMTIGTEYRTTERWYGRPVYTKLFRFGDMPNKSLKTVAHGCTATFIIRYAGTMGNGEALPLWYMTSEATLDVSTTTITITTSWDASNKAAYVQLWYVKE